MQFKPGTDYAKLLVTLTGRNLCWPCVAERFSISLLQSVIHDPNLYGSDFCVFRQTSCRPCLSADYEVIILTSSYPGELSYSIDTVGKLGHSILADEDYRCAPLFACESGPSSHKARAVCFHSQLKRELGRKRRNKRRTVSHAWKRDPPCLDL